MNTKSGLFSEYGIAEKFMDHWFGQADIRTPLFMILQTTRQFLQTTFISPTLDFKQQIR